MFTLMMADFSTDSIRASIPILALLALLYVDFYRSLPGGSYDSPKATLSSPSAHQVKLPGQSSIEKGPVHVQLDGSNEHPSLDRQLTWR
jgi:hypothetical protein